MDSLSTTFLLAIWFFGFFWFVVGFGLHAAMHHCPEYVTAMPDGKEVLKPRAIREAEEIIEKLL